MKKTMSSVVMMLFCVWGYTQELPTIIPPSPEASALSKFSNVPVSHYTGLPNISVPIHTINIKGISIPISLNYHARGVKVSEIAPRTGMGWSLAYGGNISRQVRGKADEDGFLKGDGNLMKNYILYRDTRATVDNREQTYNGIDFYPDQFTFNVAGNSGKFVLDYTDGQPIIQSFGDINISYSKDLDGKIESFIIKDDNGNTFYFGKSKDGARQGLDYQTSVGESIYYNGNVIQDSPGTSSLNTYSSWKLMDIETYQGELISYFYDSVIEGTYWVKGADKHLSDGNSTTGLTNMGKLDKIYSRVSRVNNHEKNLSKIEFNGGRDSITFISSDELRRDFFGYALNKINVYSNGKLIKGYNLNYKYTTNTDTSDLLAYFKNNGFFEQYNHRMFLDNIEQVGRNNKKIPPYQFTYNDTPLPHLFSTKQDYWGYYNASQGNGPFLRMFEYGNYTPNRRVDTIASEAGILKEIIYPTGGKAKFTYEHNIGALNINLHKLKTPAINPEIIGETKEVITLSKKDFPYDDSSGYYASYELSLPSRTNVTYSIGCLHLRDAEDTTTPDCLFQFLVNGYLVDSNGITTLNTGGWTNSNVSTSIRVLVPRHSGVSPDLHRDPRYDFSITISYDKVVNKGRIYGPGKRIKKIEHINEQGISSIKEYKYTIENEESGNDMHFSGSIFGLPGYLNKKDGENNIYLAYNDTSGMYSSFQSNFIGYSFVTEYHGTKANNIGKTEYIFSNLADSGSDYYEFPYHPPTDNEWLRGKNIKTKIFKKNNLGEYNLLKEVYNKYIHGGIVYQPDFEIPDLISVDFKLTPLGTNDQNFESDYTEELYVRNRRFFRMPLGMRKAWTAYDGYDPNNTSTWKYRVYHLTGGTLNLYKTVEKDYFTNSILKKETIYGYNYDNHYQLASTETTNSKGEVLKIKNYYTPDVTSVNSLGHDDLTSTEAAAVDQLKLQNRIAAPIQVETFKDNLLYSTQRTNYNNFNGFYLPEVIQTAKEGQILEDRVVYHNYDNKGNPVEVSKKDGTKIYYVWGYQQTQPIAKIEGYTDTELTNITTLINAAVSASNNDTDVATENTLRSALNAIRSNSNMVDSQVTTFTYDPLIGVTSITDPRGQTVYYEYDDFNRLEFVKDADGNLLKEHKYHYKN